MQKIIYFALIGLVISSILSCKKQAGEGGTSSIVGEIYIGWYDNLGALVNTFPAPEERIYITYGDNEGYDDDTRTHHDGSYKFEYLFPGSYSLYTYTDCDTCFAGTRAIIQTIEITENNQTIEVPRFTIEN